MQFSRIIFYSVVVRLFSCRLSIQNGDFNAPVRWKETRPLVAECREPFNCTNTFGCIYSNLSFLLVLINTGEAILTTCAGFYLGEVLFFFVVLRDRIWPQLFPNDCRVCREVKCILTYLRQCGSAALEHTNELHSDAWHTEALQLSRQPLLESRPARHLRGSGPHHKLPSPTPSSFTEAAADERSSQHRDNIPESIVEGRTWIQLDWHTDRDG